MKPQHRGAVRRLLLLSLQRGAAAALAALALASTPAAGRAESELPDPVRFGVAIESGDIARAREWLSAGLPPDFLADRIGTGMMIGAWEGNIPMMALFLSHGADINAANRLGEQAIMHAAWRGHVDAVRWLIERGAEVSREGLAWSALHYAVFAGKRVVAELLIRHGADVNARSTNGSSPLMMAAREGHAELARLLLGVGADTTIRNDWGDDALAWAMRNGHARIGRMVARPDEFAAAARAPSSSVRRPGRCRRRSGWTLCIARFARRRHSAT
ncbi:MAG: ankyrin repeat domain-containing protein [Burkholderiales bacterium]|nr:ankyrin repeat domain-containing protein [Burkholderiales bacterium]